MGGFQITLPDGTLAGPWVRPSARRLLQILVLRHRLRIGREELAAQLFPELAPERAANSVSKALSMARAALAPYEIVKADRNVIWLEGDIEVDSVVQRSTLARAMAMMPSPDRDACFVEGLADKGRLFDEDLYADWAAPDRDELEGLRASARLALARDRAAGHGQSSIWSAVEAWQAVLAHDGANEEACFATLAAYASTGMRDLAVRTYHRAALALHELGLEPSSSLQTAYANALASTRQGPPPAEALRSLRRSFGREAALAALRDHVGKRTRGSSGSVVVSGPAGIGKSHVLDELADELGAAGWLVVRATATTDDRRAALRALRTVLSQLDLEDAGALVRRVAEGSGSVTTDDWRNERARFLEQLVAVLDARSADRPLVLFFDDVQWIDADLQEMLGELLATSATHDWSLVLAVRTDEVDREFGAPEQVAAVALVPLATTAVTELVRHTSPEIADVALRSVVARSGGNPLFAIELARQAHLDAGPGDTTTTQVPDLIVGLLEARLARCSVEARRLLSAVSLIGDVASVDYLLQLGTQPGLDLGADATMRSIDELVAAHLLAERIDGVRLVHPLLREATTAQLNPARRAALHGLIAATSAGENAARHRLAAFDAGGRRELAPDAAAAAFAAARSARRLFSHRAAMELFEGGLRAFEAASAVARDQLRGSALDAWCQLGEIHQDSDRREDADRAFEAALAIAVTDEERARAWNGAAWTAYRAGDFAGCIAIYERGLAAMRSASPLDRARLEADVGWAYFRLGRRAEALVLLERAAAALDGADPLTRGRTLDRWATVLGATGRADEGLPIMHQAFDAVGLAGDERELGILHIHRATLYAELRRFGEALADASAALRVAKARGDPYIESVAQWATSMVHERRGDLAAALSAREEELSLLERVGNPWNVALAHAARARLLAALGCDEAADTAAEWARKLAASFDDGALAAAVEQETGRS